MRKITFSILFLFITFITKSQVVNVNTTTYTVPQLVTDVLFGSGTGGGACAGTVSNITWSTGTNFGGPNGIGYFTNTNPNFPLNSGVVLVTGNVNQVPGPNNTIQSNGVWQGDAELFNYIDGLGIDTGLLDYNDATILEFDFVPLTNTMSFDFLFASEEYGTYQCTFSDAFAFFLTNVTAGTPTSNLALIPSTNIPISVVTIRNDAFNGGCASANPAFFDKYYQLPAPGLNPANAPINFNGHTVKMTASSTVIPNNLYHIKLVIADRNDNNFDSAVFLGGGSFNIGTADISGVVGSGFEGLNDFTIANGAAICNQACREVRAGNQPITGATYQWYLNGVPIPGATSYSYVICQPGTYTVEITFAGGCVQTDSMLVEFLPPLPVSLPVDLYEASGIFNLSENTPIILNGLSATDYLISYHNTLLDAQNTSNPILNFTNYNGIDGETIYVSIVDDASGFNCVETASFILHIPNAPVPQTPPNLILCDDVSNDGIENFDLSPQIAIVLGTNNPANYTITFHTSQANADNDVSPISPINSFANTSNPQTIYIRMEDVTDPLSYGTTSFQLIVNTRPVAGTDGSTSVCETSTSVIDLFSLITGEQAGGVWTRTSGTGGNFDALAATFTPAVGATTSTFEYTANGVAPCTSDVSVATVTINAQPTAGTDGATSICAASTATIDLFSLITGEQSGGTWIRTSGTGGNFDALAATFTPAAGATTSTFEYTVNGVAPCINDTSIATININAQPNAGSDGATTICGSSTTTINLFSLITGEQAGGVWTRTLGTGGTFDAVLGTFTPDATATTSTFTYTLAAAAPCISDSSVATVAINSVPTATIVASTPSVCMNYPSPTVTFTGSNAIAPYTFIYTINNGALLTSPSSSNTFELQVPTNMVGPITYTLVSVSSANTCSQVINQSVTINVLTAPIINTPVAYRLCDDESNDGVACFDLATVVAPQVTSNATLEVTFHETMTDAQTGNYDIASPYCNINNLNNQTIYIRVFDPNAPECYAITTVLLIVEDKPTATEPTPLRVCDDNYDGFAVFNLTQKAAQILGSINPATHALTYYESLGDAQVPQNAIGNPAAYTNITANTQVIWVRVTHNTTGCNDIVALTLIVDPLPVISQPACAAYTVCETGAPVGFEQFDLATRVDCILNGQLGMSVTFYRSLADAQNNVNPITNLLYTNQQQYVQTLGIRLTNTITGCFVISTLDIRVEPLPVPVPLTQPYAVCDTDQNGLHEFDLTTLDAQILGANPTGNTITYHYTQTDAQLGIYAIANPSAFYNNIAYNQTLWVSVVNPATGCRGVRPIQLRVYESPRMPSLNNLTYCDENANNQNGIISTINLAQQTPLILAAQSLLPISNYTVTYYTSLADAQAQTNNIVNTTSYTNTSNPQTIWVVVKHNVTGCFEIGQFDVIINIPLALTPPPALALCDDDNEPNNTFTTFDLTVQNATITTGLPGYTVTYYPSWPITASSVAIANPSAYVNAQAAVQTLGVMVTSPQGCRSYTQMDIRVLPIPIPNTDNIPILPPQCEAVQGSGQQFFDLTLNANYIRNNDANVSLHYFHTEQDAMSFPVQNEITNPSNALIGDAALAAQNPRPVNQVQYIYIAVKSTVFNEYTGQPCYRIVRQPFIVNPLPIANNIGTQQICEEDASGNDGFEVFDLTSYNPQLLLGNNTTPVSTYVVNFYTDAGLTNQIVNPSAFTNTSNPQTIWVSVTTTHTYLDTVTNITHTTSCTSNTSFVIEVNPKPSIAAPVEPASMPFNRCDSADGDNDGYELYDLTQLDASVLNGQDPALFTVTYYESEYNPDAIPPLTPSAIADPANFASYTHTYWAVVTNNATGCFKTISFSMIVEQLPEPLIVNQSPTNVICVEYSSGVVVRPIRLEVVNETIPYLNEPTVPRPTYTYQWFEDGAAIVGATNDYLDIDFTLNDDQQSVFTVEMTTETAGLTCSAVSQGYEVIQSGPAEIPIGTIGYEITNAFSENQIITVNIQGHGTYLYSLDDGPRQESNVFENVGIGEHFITVWDTEGGLEYSCNPLMITQVQTIDYPVYFTPNGDGIHENWNIRGLGGQPMAKIYIFDRHGKLIKQLSSQSEGWDGTYNGNLMPSTDYWFMVEYNERQTTKQFRAHFALKR